MSGASQSPQSTGARREWGDKEGRKEEGSLGSPLLSLSQWHATPADARAGDITCRQEGDHPFPWVGHPSGVLPFPWAGHLLLWVHRLPWVRLRLSDRLRPWVVLPSEAKDFRLWVDRRYRRQGRT